MSARREQAKLPIAPKDVRKLFRECGPHLTPPNLAACLPLAHELESLRIWARNRNLRRKPRPILGAKARRLGREFLEEVTSTIEDLETRPEAFLVGNLFLYDKRSLELLIRDLTEVKVAVSRVLDNSATANELNTQFRPMNLAALLICKHAQLLWAKSGSKVPHSVAPDSPLCRFVRAALALAGIHYSEDSVSEMLRKRSHRQR